MGSPTHASGKEPVPRRRGRFALGFSLVLVSLAVAAPSASAANHEILIREVFAGGANTSYVVLQAFNAGQNAVNTHDVTAYGPAATGSIGSFEFTGNVSSGANQMTILVGDTASTGPSRDGTMPSLDLDPAGGAVCWDGTPDCMSWGNFSGSTPSATGTPAVAMSGGQALHRSIAAGCATLLEFSDDTNQSNVNFSLQAPNPRNNVTPPGETGCNAPNTAISSASVPAGGKTTNTGISFTFSATPSAGASFECKLDSGAFEDCAVPQPQVYSSLDGDNAATGTPHTFQVRAKNANGPDPSPATHSWTVDTVAPTATITGQPANPSPGGSAAFSFQANESSTFKCILEGPKPSALSSCSSGKTYATLPDGSYTFKVQPTDTAGNPGVEDTYTWMVDNSLADTIDPETTINSKPPDPTSSTTVEFTYGSNEPGSTFECKMDGESFTSCASTGKTYAGLSEGPHTFQVRATDTSLNTDESPAGYSFSVVLPVTQPEVQPPTVDPPPPPPIAPNTTITLKPKAKTKDRTPTFKFNSSIAGAAYECKLDRKALKPCRSPLTTKPLSYAGHTLKVAAIAGGLKDSTPAVVSFKVVKPK
jgi:hypothetical protein